MLIFVDSESSLFFSHPAQSFIDPFVLSLREAPGFIVFKELLSDTTLCLLFGHSLGSHIVFVRDYRSYLEELRQLLGVIRLVEPIRVNEVPQLQSFEVSTHFVS